MQGSKCNLLMLYLGHFKDTVVGSFILKVTPTSTAHYNSEEQLDEAPVKSWDE